MTTVTTKSDQQVKVDVLDELDWDAIVDETEVGVQVHDGIVTLAGNITSYPKKMAARNSAHRVFGVLDVVDHMQVRIPSAARRSDENVASAVRNALTWDLLVPDDLVTSTVTNGTVTLEGAVDYWIERRDAERAVNRLLGVSNVLNRITVRPAQVETTTIKRKIEDALERQAEREAKRIGVSVHDGVVTLTGTVRSWGERNAVERAAGYATGVRQVQDKTTVDPYQ